MPHPVHESHTSSCTQRHAGHHVAQVESFTPAWSYLGEACTLACRQKKNKQPARASSGTNAKALPRTPNSSPGLLASSMGPAPQTMASAPQAQLPPADMQQAISAALAAAQNAPQATQPHGQAAHAAASLPLRAPSQTQATSMQPPVGTCNVPTSVAELIALVNVQLKAKHQISPAQASQLQDALRELRILQDLAAEPDESLNHVLRDHGNMSAMQIVAVRQALKKLSS